MVALPARQRYYSRGTVRGTLPAARKKNQQNQQELAEGESVVLLFSTALMELENQL